MCGKCKKACPSEAVVWEKKQTAEIEKEKYNQYKTQSQIQTVSMEIKELEKNDKTNLSYFSNCFYPNCIMWKFFTIC